MQEGQFRCRGCGHEARRHYPIGGCVGGLRDGLPRCGCDWQGTDDTALTTEREMDG